MTVAELVEVLSGLDPNLPVVVSGYEDGYESLTVDNVTVASIVPDAVIADIGYLGDHADPGAVNAARGSVLSRYTPDASLRAVVDVVVLARGARR